MDSDQQQPPQMPADTGAPPAQQPYQPPQQPAASYPPPPQPQSRGFNWLACCGITCLVLLIVGGLVGYCGYRAFKPLLDLVFGLDAVAGEVRSAELQTIKDGAMELDTGMLVGNATMYEQQWLALEGEIATVGFPEEMNFSGRQFNTEQTTNYILDNNVIVLDLTQAAPVGSVGDRIRVYGRCYVWDLDKAEDDSFISGMVREVMEQDPDWAGSTTLIFCFAKEVTRVSVADGAPAEPADTPADQEAVDDSGWLK